VGTGLGTMVGTGDGNVDMVGSEVGEGVGFVVGVDVGAGVGNMVGTALGSGVGSEVGTMVGGNEGNEVGTHVKLPGKYSQHGVPKELPLDTFHPMKTCEERTEISVGKSSQN
jgi:hypothetical protein